MMNATEDLVLIWEGPKEEEAESLEALLKLEEIPATLTRGEGEKFVLRVPKSLLQKAREAMEPGEHYQDCWGDFDPEG